MVQFMKNFISQIHPSHVTTQPSFWFIFQNEEILLQQNSNSIIVPQFTNIDELNFNIEQQQYLGIYENTPCFAAQVRQTEATALPPDMAFQLVRQSHEALGDDDLFHVITRAKQILYWDKSTQFCGYCGNKTQQSSTERAKVCLICKTLAFPSISPVMLALIWRDNEILLARSPHFMPGVYSILAGFVEPGETLEHAVIREVKEEVGITIKNLNYFASQPWPFPSNLMLGFIAEYDSGEIQVDAELEDAQWFSINKLPTLPKPISLSRRMIDAYLATNFFHPQDDKFVG
jgi:NAD+ diphosphatase